MTLSGPAFSSKFLYFAGYGRIPGQQQPLILDQYVALAVNRYCGTSWGSATWPSEVYDDYLMLAHTWAGEWSCEPDVVERSLFSAGQVSSLAFGVLSGGPAT